MRTISLRRTLRQSALCLAAGIILCFFSKSAAQAEGIETQISYGDLLDVYQQSYEGTVYSGPIDLTGVDYLTFRRTFVTGGKCCERNGAYAGGVIRVSVVAEGTGEVKRTLEKWYAGHGDEELRFDTADLSGMHRISAYVTIGTGECEDCGTRKTVSVKLTGLTGHAIHNVPVVTVGPSAQETVEGGSVSFSVQASYADTYRWQKYAGGAWTDLSDGAAGTGTLVGGAGTGTLSLGNVSFADHQTAYRCVCGNSFGEQAVSGDAPLTVRDVTPPVFGAACAPTGWTNRAVTVEVQGARDTGSGLPADPYSFDGGSTWTAASSLQTERNGSYRVCVRDNVGNVSSADVAVANIDRTPPVIKSFLPAPDGWTNGPVELKAEAEDKESGLFEGSYSFDGGRTFGAKNSMRVSDNGTYEVCVRDRAGNISRRSVKVNKIDILGPKVELTAKPLTWTAGEVTVSVAAEEAAQGSVSGLPGDPYSFDGGETWSGEREFTVRENGEVRVLARDVAGNVSEGVMEVANIDKAPPVIEKCLADTTEWTNRDVRLSVGAVDRESGLSGEAYSFDGGETWTAKPEFLARDNGHYDLRVRDAVGNMAKARISVANLDKKAPAVKLQADVTEWTRGNVTVAVSAEDEGGGSGLAEAFASFDQGATWEKRAAFTVGKNGSYSVWIRDKAGNIRKDAIHIGNIDKEPPFIEAVTPSTTEWSGQDVQIGVKAGDRGSGLADEAYSFNGGATYKSGAAVIVSDNGQIDVVVRDKAGNTAERSLTVDNIDKTPPEITSFWLEPDGWTNREVTLHAEASDRESGLAHQAYSFDGGETWGDEKTFSVRENGEYKVLVRDRCGNTVQARSKVGRIDKNPPSVVLQEIGRDPEKKTVQLQAVVTDLESGPLAQGFSWDGGETFGESDVIEVYKSGIYKVTVLDAAYNRASASALVLAGENLLDRGEIPRRYQELKRDTGGEKKAQAKADREETEPEKEVEPKEEELVLADRRLTVETLPDRQEKGIDGFTWRQFLLLALMSLLLLLLFLLLLLILWFHTAVLYGIREDGSLRFLGWALLWPDHGQYRTKVRASTLERTGTGRGRLKLPRAFVRVNGDRELKVSISGDEFWYKVEEEIDVNAAR